MINHFRTLLANLSGGVVDDTIGAAYIPTDFTARDLPFAYDNVRTAIFGRDPDRQMVNYRLAQILPLIHSTDYAAYAYDHDVRVTYRRFPDPVFQSTLFGWSVQKLDGTQAGLQLSGELPIRTTDPQLVGEWDVFVEEVSTDVLLRVSPRTPAGPSSTTTTAIVSGGWTDPVTLTRDASFKLQTSVLDGNRWLIRRLQRPATGISDVLSHLDALGSGTVDALLEGTAEPYVTFRNLWTKSKDPALRLSGLLFAYQRRLSDYLGVATPVSRPAAEASMQLSTSGGSLDPASSNDGGSGPKIITGDTGPVGDAIGE